MKTADRYIAHPVIECGGQLFILELDERTQSSRLLRLPNDEVIAFESVSRKPLRISDEQFFFFTRDQIFLYDTKEGNIRDKRFSEYLAETEVAFSQKTAAFYLVGEGGLWRVSLLGGELTPVSLPTRVLGGPRLSARGDRVFVAHSQGFIILDPLGNVRWDSVDLFIRAASDGLSPQLTEHYVLFTALGQGGGTDLRIHELKELKAFKTFAYAQRLLCPPLLVHGRLVVAVGGAGAVELNCAV
jgi:hypothetical protein